MKTVSANSNNKEIKDLLEFTDQILKSAGNLAKERGATAQQTFDALVNAVVRMGLISSNYNKEALVHLANEMRQSLVSQVDKLPD